MKLIDKLKAAEDVGGPNMKWYIPTMEADTRPDSARRKIIIYISEVLMADGTPEHRTNEAFRFAMRLFAIVDEHEAAMTTDLNKSSAVEFSAALQAEILRRFGEAKTISIRHEAGELSTTTTATFTDK